jgi:hypothetical protein
MKSRELYSGAAPSAMGQMGAGLMEAGANIGRTLQQGYANMGQGITQGIMSAAKTFADYKQTQSQVKAQEKALDTFMPYLPKGMQETLSKQREEMNNSDKTSLADKKAYYDTTMAMAGNMVGQQFKMQQIGAQEGGATGRTVITQNAETARNTESLTAAEKRNAETLRSAEERARMEGLFNLYGNAPMTNMQRSSAFQPSTLGIGTQAGGGIYKNP